MARVDYVEVRCKSALNRVQGMPFSWSLNPYAGCAHACDWLQRGVSPGWQAWEPVAAWDRLARQARGMLNVASRLRGDELGSEDDWRDIQEPHLALEDAIEPDWSRLRPDAGLQRLWLARY
jgi:hypothetical protein